MSPERHDEQNYHLANLRKRVAAGQIDRRGFVQLAAAFGLESAVAAAMADEATATPFVQGQGGRGIEASYDYIVVGAGSAGVHHCGEAF
jgi:hypothetical protein